MNPLTLDQYLMDRDEKYPITDDQRDSAIALVAVLNILQEAYGAPLFITSGYRPPIVNAGIVGAHHGDAHEKCCGVDLRDPDKNLSTFCLHNLDLLEELDLWMEAPQSAKNHVHLQSYPPASGNRVFIA